MYKYDNLTMNVIACLKGKICCSPSRSPSCLRKRVYYEFPGLCWCSFPYTTTGEWLFKMVVAVLALLCLFAGASSQRRLFSILYFSYRCVVNMSHVYTYVFLYVLKP